jgi:hypothetical protein
MTASDERGEEGANGYADVDGSSSADENTAIMKKMRNNYGATAGAEQDDEVQEEGTQDERVGPVEEQTHVSGTVKKRRSSLGRGRKVGRGQRQSVQNGIEQEEESDSWWRSFIEKYGSVELENKGSVARDHLALGTFCIDFWLARIVVALPLLPPLHAFANCRRTDFPGLAANVALLCFHWNRSHPTLPPQHINRKIRRPKLPYINRLISSNIITFVSQSSRAVPAARRLSFR